MHKTGDIVITKEGNRLLVLAETDVIKEEMTEFLQTMEPIIIAIPVRFETFTKDGFLVTHQHSSIKEPFIAEYYNRVYLYQKEIENEIGFVTNPKIMSDILELMKIEILDTKKKPDQQRRAVRICRTLLNGLTQFQKDLQANDTNGILYH